MHIGREFAAGTSWVWSLIIAARNIIFGSKTKKEDILETLYICFFQAIVLLLLHKEVGSTLIIYTEQTRKFTRIIG